jgi:hypothetical protein
VLGVAPLVWVKDPVADSAGVSPPGARAATGGTGGLSVVVTALPYGPSKDPSDDRSAPDPGNESPDDPPRQVGWSGSVT